MCLLKMTLHISIIVGYFCFGMEIRVEDIIYAYILARYNQDTRFPKFRRYIGEISVIGGDR